MWRGRSKCRCVSRVSRILGCRWDSWVQEMEHREVQVRAVENRSNKEKRLNSFELWNAQTLGSRFTSLCKPPAWAWPGDVWAGGCGTWANCILEVSLKVSSTPSSDEKDKSFSSKCA
ncbi:hypothetical protein VTJ04DRAFT_10669 [Mycothermus thermophilus]|uniref:uncharacterized protein n=1 Tax=Humicola insolens TaxID=85995 RepID=UPI0037441698